MNRIQQAFSVFSVIGLLFFAVSVFPASAAVTTYTEDFSTSTYFDASTSSDFTTWTAEGARPIYNTNHATPAPFIHDNSGVFLKTSATVDDYIYSAGFGSAASAILYIYDITAETYSTLNLSSQVDGTIQDIEIDTTNDYAYLAWSNGAVGGLTAVDISTPSAPALSGTATGFPNAYRVAFDGPEEQILLLSNGSAPSLASFDLDGGAPSYFGEVALTTGVSYRNMVKHPSGTTVFIGGSNSLAPITAVDISDIEAPAIATFSGDDFGMNSVEDMKMVGNYMFLVGDNDSGDPVAKEMRILVGLSVLDIYEYSFTTSTDMPQFVTAGETFANDTLFYVYTDTADGRRVDSFAVTTSIPEFDPTPITLEGSSNVGVNWTAQPSYADVSPLVGQRLFLPHNSQGLFEIDVDTDDAPGTQVVELSVGGSGADAVVVGASAYVANSSSQTVQQISVSDPTSMSVTDTESTATCGEPTRIEYQAEDQLLMTACGDYYTYLELADGFVTPDFVDTGEAVNDIAIGAGYVYLANASGLSTYSYSTNTQTGSTITGVGTPRSVEVNDNYLFLVSDNGLHIFDLADSSSPSLIRSFNPVGTEFDIDIDGEYAYVVGNNMDAILISELVDPTATPTENNINTQAAERIEVNDGYAHIGSNGGPSDEYQIVNVRDAESMEQLTLSNGLEIGSLGGGFGFSDGWVFVADGSQFRASHMAYNVTNSIYSSIVDTVSTQITAVNYTFNQTANGGQVSYYVSNNNGTNWAFVGTTTTDTAVTGSHTFGTVGSQLRWRANMVPETGAYAAAPIITSASLEYTSNETLVEDVTGPSVTAFPLAATGPFDGPQSVELTASESGSTIYYTLDGSTPDTTDSVYDPQNPLIIASTTTVQAVAVDPSNNAGGTLSEAYTIGSTADTTAPSSMVDPGSFTGGDGPFSAPFNVELVCEDAVDYNPSIRYTTDGSSPTSSSLLYITPINIAADTVLTFNCTDASGNTETSDNVEVYEFGTLITDTTAPTSMIQPPAGTYPSGTSISIEVSDDFDSAPTTYYTTDGSTPTTINGFIYSVPFTIFTDTTVKFFSIDATGNAESVQTAAYIIGGDDEDLETPPTEDEPELDPEFVPDEDAPTISISPEGGTYATPQTVQLTCDDGLDPNATIYYTQGLSISTLVYEEPITVASNVTIRAFCIDASDNRSATLVESYVITNATDDTVAPTTTHDCPADGYFGELSVSLSAEDDNDANPAIYYSTDGTDPIRLAAFTYRRPIILNSKTTLKWFSRDASGNAEEVGSKVCKVYDASKLSLKAKNKKKGKGNVRIVNKKNNKVLKTFQAFKKGGVKASIVKVRGEKRVAAIQFKKSKVLKIFDLNGNLLGKKKFRKKKATHQLIAKNLYKGKKSGEILVTQLRKKKGDVKVRLFTVTKKNKPKQRATTTLTEGLDKLIAKGHKLRYKKKKKRVTITTPKGKKAQVTLKIKKKGKKFRIQVI